MQNVSASIKHRTPPPSVGEVLIKKYKKASQALVRAMAIWYMPLAGNGFYCVRSWRNW